MSMKKKSGLSKNIKLKSTNTIKSFSSSNTTQQSFWFRLWLGFLIGANIAFALMTLYIITNNEYKVLIPASQGILFICLAIIDIWFMIKLLRWHKLGLFGTLAITTISLILNIVWGADVLVSILYGAIPAFVTLIFVLPNWSKYK